MTWICCLYNGILFVLEVCYSPDHVQMAGKDKHKRGDLAVNIMLFFGLSNSRMRAQKFGQ